MWPFVEEARRQGARLVVIDPYRTRTAACADWYLPVNPGTDVALALGMLHVVIGEDLYDADYVARYTVGFDALRERVREYPPEQVARWTGIAAEDIRRLAREYATVRPAAIRLNYGYSAGEMAAWPVCHRYVALHYGLLEGSWWRAPAFHQRRVRNRPFCTRARGSGTGGAHDQHGPVRTRLARDQASAGQGAVCIQLNPAATAPARTP